MRNASGIWPIENPWTREGKSFCRPRGIEQYTETMHRTEMLGGRTEGGRESGTMRGEK